MTIIFLFKKIYFKFEKFPKDLVHFGRIICPSNLGQRFCTCSGDSGDREATALLQRWCRILRGIGPKRERISGTKTWNFGHAFPPLRLHGQGMAILFGCLHLPFLLFPVPCVRPIFHWPSCWSRFWCWGLLWAIVQLCSHYGHAFVVQRRICRPSGWILHIFTGLNCVEERVISISSATSLNQRFLINHISVVNINQLISY